MNWRDFWETNWIILCRADPKEGAVVQINKEALEGLILGFRWDMRNTILGMMAAEMAALEKRLEKKDYFDLGRDKIRAQIVMLERLYLRIRDDDQLSELLPEVPSLRAAKVK